MPIYVIMGIMRLGVDNMEWKWISDISGFENVEGFKIYSNGDVVNYWRHEFDKKTGRVKGVTIDYGIEKKVKGSVDSKGYKYIDLRKFDCVVKNPKIHRLVALSFLKNPLGKEQINHIDGNKLN